MIIIPPLTSSLKDFYNYINELDDLKLTGTNVPHINYVFSSHVKGIEETLKKILKHLDNKIDGKNHIKIKNLVQKLLKEKNITYKFILYLF